MPKGECCTKDGCPVHVSINIGGCADLEGADLSSLYGVGLYRTEFLFVERDKAPTLQEQIAEYRKVFQSLPGKDLIVRTLDIGGDKGVPYLEVPAEENPFLGCRGIRLCVQRTGVLHVLVGFIGGEPEAAFTKLRLQGYIDAHRQCGAEFSSSWIYNIFPDSDYADRKNNYAKMNISSHFSGGFSVVGRMLDDMPDAIETINDEVAMGILSGLKARGVRVPEDVWLAGYDDTQYVSMLETPLTTIRQPVYDMAEKTVSVLLDRIRDPDAPMRIHYIDPILKLRSTSR